MPYLRGRPHLLAAFRSGDRAALTEVYWHYVSGVERVARHGFALAHRAGARVPGAAEAEAREVVQETFLRAFEERARRAYDGVRDYGPYLGTIARNVLADRARARGRELATADVEALDAACATDEPDSEPPWATPEVVAVVEAYLGGLDAELRALHRARYVEGLSQEDAARALGLSRQQLRTREGRLRDGLARALARAGLR